MSACEMKQTEMRRCCKMELWLKSMRPLLKLRQPSQTCVTVAVLSCMLLVPTTVSATSCRRRLTTQLIQYKDCLPKRLLTYSCVGTCVTNAHISSATPWTMQHTCFQCKEAVVRTRQVRVRCPNEDIMSSSGFGGFRPFKMVKVNVTVPRECQCEPCTFSDAVDLSHSNT